MPHVRLTLLAGLLLALPGASGAADPEKKEPDGPVSYYRDVRRIYRPPDYTSFPLRKDFYLPDDAARSPGAGVRHMERSHAPAETAGETPLRSGTGT